MSIDFFEKEVKKAQSRFNKTFGPMNACNLKTRQKAILTIVGMARLAEKIQNAKEKSDVRDEINIFVQKKENLTRIFTTIDNHQKERKKHENRNTRRQGHRAYGSNVCR